MVAGVKLIPLFVPFMVTVPPLSAGPAAETVSVSSFTSVSFSKTLMLFSVVLTVVNTRSSFATGAVFSGGTAVMKSKGLGSSRPPLPAVTKVLMKAPVVPS